MIEISQVVVGGCEEVSLTCAGSGMVVVHSATFLPLEGDCEQVRGDVDSGQYNGGDSDLVKAWLSFTAQPACLCLTVNR